MSFIRRFWKNRVGAMGLTLLLLIIFGVVVLPALLSLEPSAMNPRLRLQPPGFMPTGSWDAALGTDQLGRDLLARVLVGGRVSLLISLSAVIVSSIVGVSIGLIAGYFGRSFDNVVMRIVDTQLAMPTILLAILVMATIGSSVINLVIVLALSNWMIFARVARASVLSLKQLSFIEAAHAAGAGDPRILSKHVLLNSWTPILVVGTQQVAQMILLESSLSFLGVGVPLSVTTWGAMVRDGRLYLEIAWWVSVVPGLMLALTVMAINFVGDGLRDTFDPQLKTRSKA